MRWMDGVEKDLRNLGVDDWKTKPQERDIWRKFLEQANIQKGLYNNNNNNNNNKKNKMNAYRILVEKSEEKRPLGRPRRRWADNIKMDLRGMEWDK
jgi:hypothetical protein